MTVLWIDEDPPTWAWWPRRTDEPLAQLMSEDVELEVVELHRGPADGERAEAPVGAPEIWRFVTGVGYCRYGRRRRHAQHMTFRRQVLPDAQAMADYLHANFDLTDSAQVPWLHVDAPTPHPRKVRVEQDTPPAG